MSDRPCPLAPLPNPKQPHWCPDTTHDDVREQLQVMRRFEETTYAARDYLPANWKRTEGAFQQRRRTVEYLYQVVDFTQCFSRDIVTYSTTHLMDRYLATSAGNRTFREDTTGNRYQLVALTCFYMAVKLLEPQKIGVESLVPLTNGLYAPSAFLQMEWEILRALDWCVAQGPTPLAFVHLLMPLLPMAVQDAKVLYNHVQYQLELAVSDYNLCCGGVKPSELAVAAIWNALESIDLVSKEKVGIQWAVMGALHWDSERTLLEGHISNVQAKLRHLLLAAFSLATPSIASTSRVQTNILAKKDTTDSPGSTVRKDAAEGVSPSSSEGHDSINDVTQVDWL